MGRKRRRGSRVHRLRSRNSELRGRLQANSWHHMWQTVRTSCMCADDSNTWRREGDVWPQYRWSNDHGPCLVSSNRENKNLLNVEWKNIVVYTLRGMVRYTGSKYVGAVITLLLLLLILTLNIINESLFSICLKNHCKALLHPVHIKSTVVSTPIPLNRLLCVGEPFQIWRSLSEECIWLEYINRMRIILGTIMNV